jgi:D-amino-acid dehydrogenase
MQASGLRREPLSGSLVLSHIAIIGAGITGVTSAYALLQRGHTVTVIEKHRCAAMETSYANGGQLSASNAEVWNSWSTVRKGLSWMLRPDAPLLMSPRPSRHKLAWLAEFCGQIRHHRANTIATVRLALEARERLFEMARAEGVDFDLERRGILHFYWDRDSFETAARGNALLNEAGLERYAVCKSEMRQIEPALQGEFYGGFYTPSDASGDICKFTRGLAAACARRGADFQLGVEADEVLSRGRGVSIRLKAAADGLPAGELEADAVLICAGVASHSLARSLGDRINIYPVKGYSITVALPDEDAQRAAPWVSLLDEDAKIVTSRLGKDRFRIAGTAEFNGYSKDIRADRIAPLVRWCERLFPQAPTCTVVPWAGLRPMTPSMLPRVGPGRRPGVFYNTGHGHLGWTLSAATAHLAADSIELALAA